MFRRLLGVIVRHPVAALFIVVCLSLIGLAVASRTGAGADDARIAEALATPMSLTAAFAEFDIALHETAAPDELGEGVVVLANYDAEEFDPSLSSNEGYVTVVVFPDREARERAEGDLVDDAARVFARENVVVLYAPGLRDRSAAIAELIPPIPPRLDITTEP